MSRAEEFYKEYAIWNGTILINAPQIMQAYADQEVKAKLEDFVYWFNENDATQGIIITRVGEYLNKLKTE